MTILTMLLLAADFAVVEKVASKVSFYMEDGTRVGEVSTGATPHEAALSADGRTLYVSDNGVLWMTDVAADGGNTISVIDVATMKRTRVISLGKYRRPHGLWLESRLWSTTEKPDGVAMVEPKSGKLIRWFDTKGENPHMVAWSAKRGRAYVSNVDSNTVAVVDPASGVTKLIEGMSRPQGGVFNADESVFYVTNAGGAFIALIDTATNTVTGKIETGKGPARVALTPDGHTLVYNLGEDQAVAFADVATRKQTAVVPIGGRPLSCTLSLDGTRAYAGIQDQDKIVVVSVAERKIARTIALPKGAGPDPVIPLLRAQRGAYDVVIAGGRVMDPESGLDAVRNIGIRDGKIAAISERALTGAAMIDAKGRVVAPGFIDLHAHGQTNQSNEYQAHDGVTTALELEVGVPSVSAYLKSREGKALLNYGATSSHGAVRAMSMKSFAADSAAWKDSTARWNEIAYKARYQALGGPEEYTAMAAGMERGLREGGIGLGVAHQYYPAATREEIFRVFEMAARWKVPIFTHVRSMSVDGMQEVIANAAATGASLRIVHVNSMSLGSLPLVLDMIDAARKRGLDITTEAYPYTAASTFIESAIFDDGWQERLAMSYGDVQWVKTGERLTKETFERYRKDGGVVIMHMMKPEWIRRAMATPFVMVASDGMPYAPGAHPRSAGTFTRVLGLYSREEKVLPLMEALGKMTILPARRLEAIAPAMKNKGRLRVGADADVTVFDPERVRDTATFEKGLSFSAGIDHVLVNGVAVVRDGKSVADTYPGRPVLGYRFEAR